MKHPVTTTTTSLEKGAMVLTPEEIELIQKRRADQNIQRAARAFQICAMQTAAKFAVWSEETGEGLTFSTFVNTFDYQSSDAKQMYDAVKRIHEAACLK